MAREFHTKLPRAYNELQFDLALVHFDPDCTIRKPYSLSAVAGAALFRRAVRQLPLLEFQEPPRKARTEPVSGPKGLLDGEML